MHELNQGALALLVTLLPGFLALRVRDFFVPVKARDNFERISEVVAYSLVLYLLVSSFQRVDWRPDWMTLLGEPSHTERGASAVGLDRFVQALALAAILLGAVVGWVESRDLHYSIARRLRLTDRSGLRDVWQEAFSRNGAEWVLVHLADGRRVRGWPVLSSERGSRPALFLSSAAWVRDDGGSVPIPGPGILITEQAEIRYAEFLIRESGARREP